MRPFIVIGFLITSLCWGQKAAPNAPQQPAASQEQAQPSTAPKIITIPAGTRIPLELSSPVTNKAARRGSSVRAVTGFPVTMGTQLAIPVGAYVDGVIDNVTKGGSSGRTLQIHFTRLIYPNGYTVAIDGANVQAKTLRPDRVSPDAAALQTAGAGTLAFAGQQSAPPLPPLPHSGPNTGLIVGGVVGVAAVGILSAVLIGHSRRNNNGVLFDTGWQFEMVLQNPLTIDIASAGVTPGAN